MRHIVFRRLTVVNGTPGNWGVTNKVDEIVIYHIQFSYDIKTRNTRFYYNR